MTLSIPKLNIGRIDVSEWYFHQNSEFFLTSFYSKYNGWQCTLVFLVFKKKTGQKKIRNLGPTNVYDRESQYLQFIKQTIGLPLCPVSEGNHGQGSDPCTLIHLRTMVRASDPGTLIHLRNMVTGQGFWTCTLLLMVTRIRAFTSELVAWGPDSDNLYLLQI